MARRADYYINHDMIKRAYHRLKEVLKRRPTAEEIRVFIFNANDGKELTVKTIQTHIKKLRFDPRKSILKLRDEDVLEAMYDKAEKGDVSAARLISEVQGWNEESEKATDQHNEKVEKEKAKQQSEFMIAWTRDGGRVTIKQSDESENSDS